MTEIVGFNITQRHYDIIINQVIQNLPYESGGFVGGKDHTITAILPVFNQDISNKTNIFSISRDDLERAHLFFQKHGLDYYGTYHSHPKTDPTPSDQDLSHIQKYLFIIGLVNPEQPDFAAYVITGQKSYQRTSLKILPDSKFSVKDLQNNTTSSSQIHDTLDTSLQNQQLHNILNETPLDQTYKKDFKNNSTGDFSTLA